MRFRANVLSDTQKRALDVMLARADECMLVDAAELPGNTATTLKSLARRHLVTIEDGTDIPPLWRLTLRGLLEARRWRGLLAASREGGGERCRAVPEA